MEDAQIRKDRSICDQVQSLTSIERFELTNDVDLFHLTCRSLLNDLPLRPNVTKWYRGEDYDVY